MSGPPDEGEAVTLESAIAGMEHNADLVARLAPELREARWMARLALQLIRVLGGASLDPAAVEELIHCLHDHCSWLKEEGRLVP